MKLKAKQREDLVDVIKLLVDKVNTKPANLHNMSLSPAPSPIPKQHEEPMISLINHPSSTQAEVSCPDCVNLKPVIENMELNMQRMEQRITSLEGDLPQPQPLAPVQQGGGEFPALGGPKHGVANQWTVETPHGPSFHQSPSKPPVHLSTPSTESMMSDQCHWVAQISQPQCCQTMTIWRRLR